MEKGNIEFLMLLKYNADKEVENSKINIEHIVITLIITLNRGGPMLIQLNIKQFGIIEKATIELKNGLTVLSGETGAGNQ